MSDLARSCNFIILLSTLVFVCTFSHLPSELFLLTHILIVIGYFVGLFISYLHRLKVEWLWISVGFCAFARSFPFSLIGVVEYHLPTSESRSLCHNGAVFSNNVMGITV
jgi:hypothetical protein